MKAWGSPSIISVAVGYLSRYRGEKSVKYNRRVGSQTFHQLARRFENIAEPGQTRLYAALCRHERGRVPCLPSMKRTSAPFSRFTGSAG